MYIVVEIRDNKADCKIYSFDSHKEIARENWPELDQLAQIFPDGSVSNREKILLMHAIMYVLSQPL